MLTVLNLHRDGRRGENAELLDVLERLATETYGSATNAAANCIRSSQLYQAMLLRMRDEGYGKSATPTPKARKKTA